jgi:hypothetical protein
LNLAPDHDLPSPIAALTAEVVIELKRKQYLRTPQRLLAQTSQVPAVPTSEIQSALTVLSRCPVAGYIAFTEEEVRLIAAYRVFLQQGGYEFVWPSIIAGEPMAWPFALHEIEELRVFEERGVSPFDRSAWNQNQAEAHVHATVFELQYLRAWAKQMGMDAHELALEMEHPVRKGTQQHRHLLSALQTLEGWPSSSDAERQIARAFWNSILKRGAS